MDSLGPSRWRGQPHRLDVWYATFTDPRSGAGFWVHVELRVDREGGAGLHGWASVFPADGPPRTERFGPVAVARAGGEEAWAEGAGVRVGPGVLEGAAGALRWSLAWADEAPPLWTFPRWAWDRELLPGAQVVAAPTATFRGTFADGDRTWALRDARGAVARIYGHGNAERWGWLHADLGRGDVLELVAAASTRSIFRPLGVLPFLRLRVDGEDWPRHGLRVALRSHAELGLPTFRADVTEGERRVVVQATVPVERSVVLRYEDPDGRTATCTNSERAHARVDLLRRDTLGWSLERSWTLDGTAHAEVGLRP